MFIKKALFAVALATMALALSPPAAQAIPTGETLVVFAYFSDSAKTHLVGQKWHGCGQPSGSWGIQTNLFTVFFPAC